MMNGRLNLRLDQQLLERLKQLASEKGITVSRLIRQLLEEKLTKEE